MVDAEDEWEGHAWSILLLWQAHKMTGDTRYPQMAVRQTAHLLGEHDGDPPQAVTYHALRRSAAETGTAAYSEAAQSMRVRMLGQWPKHCNSRPWLLACLRVFGDSFFPYE